MKYSFSFSLLAFLAALQTARGADSCVPNDEVEEGSCIIVTECDVAIQSIRYTGSHPYRRCGFRGKLEVVCCPRSSSRFGPSTTTSSTPKLSKRIADIECENLIKNSIPPLDLHIIGGESASQGEFPHMVALGYNQGDTYRFNCGGALISDRFVLTAAHCVDNRERIVPEIVRAGVVELGDHKWNDDTDITIEKIIKHPDYARSQKYDDLALLRLEKPILLGSVPNAACLYTSNEDPKIELSITGWGTINNTRDIRSNVLKKANVTVVERSSCTTHYANILKLPRGIISSQICAGDSEHLRDTCQGDSGGPLQGLTSRDGLYRIVGVTSFGRGCGSYVPGVYTRVVDYLDWIESVVWPQ